MALSFDDRRGITCLIVGGVGFSASDALTKLSTLSLPFGEVLAVRGLFTSLLFLVLLAARGQLSDLKVAADRAVVVRTLFDFFGTITFVLAISNARLGDSTAIVLSSPIFMTLLAVIMYGEKVRWHRWSAIVLGIAGVALITKPQPDSIQLLDAAGRGGGDLLGRARSRHPVHRHPRQFAGGCVLRHGAHRAVRRGLVHSPRRLDRDGREADPHPGGDRGLLRPRHDPQCAGVPRRRSRCRWCRRSVT